MSPVLVALFLSVALVLLVVGGLLAATEAAISVRSRAELEVLADAATRSGSAIRSLAHEGSESLNAMGFARVIAETLSGVLITLVLAYTIDELWITLLLSTLIVTATTFVLVGSSPRTVGTHHPDEIIRFAAPLVRVVRLSLGPVAGALKRLGDRVTPGRGPGVSRIRDEQQLLSMVDQATEQAVLEEDDRDYIHSLVEFGDTLVREVMVPRIDMVTVDDTAPVREGLELLLSSRFSRLPVVTEGDVDAVEGVIYLRDVSGFAHRRPEESETAPLSRLMKPAMFVTELQRADDLLRQMQREATHLALVVDEYGGISGLVTLEDLIEELLGEISDEHDRDVPEVELLEDGSFTVTARLTIDRLSEMFGIELEDEDVDTVGGLVAKHLGRLAAVGDQVVVSGIQLEALTTERKRQSLVTVGARWVGTDPETLEHHSGSPAVDDAGEKN